MSASNGELYTTGSNGPRPGGRWPADHDAGDAGPVRADPGYRDGDGPARAPVATATPWRRKRQSEFAGDIEATQLRTRLSMLPDRIAEPPPSEEAAPSAFGAWRITGAAAIVVLGVGGYLWGHASNTAAASRSDVSGAALLAAPDAAPQFAPASYEPKASEPKSSEPKASVSEPAATGMRSASIAIPPAAIDSATVAKADTGTVPKAAPPARHANAAEIAMMMKQGELFMANSDVSGARLVFQRAAEAGEPAAALALAETYDPVVLGEAGARRSGLIPDVMAARSWYEKAKDLGSTAAPERLARLDQFDQ